MATLTISKNTSMSGLVLLTVFLLVTLSRWSEAYILKDAEDFLRYPHYHTQLELEDSLAQLVKRYPWNSQVEIIGRSLEGRPLLVLHIGQNVVQRTGSPVQEASSSTLLKPMVKFIGNMHGDETISRQMIIYLGEYLLENYQTSLEVQRLVNSTEIYLMATMNPDGFARAKEGNCESLPNFVGRVNAAGVDLNRDFPDRLESQEQILLRSPSRQPETAALMQWILSRPFVLSANFHGGALVVSYPYDNSIAQNECCVESPSPDDKVFRLMAQTYANNHPVMHHGSNCNDNFTGGITNGAKWYELKGGMQDFNYAFSNCFEITVELSCCKYPLAQALPREWLKNKRSLLELLRLSHMGIKGIVHDINGYPIHGASVIVEGLEEKPIRTTSRGEYWRLLTPGKYRIHVAAFGYETSPVKEIEVTTVDRTPIAQRIDFVLEPVKLHFDGISSYYSPYFFRH